MIRTLINVITCVRHDETVVRRREKPVNSRKERKNEVLTPDIPRRWCYARAEIRENCVCVCVCVCVCERCVLQRALMLHQPDLHQENTATILSWGFWWWTHTHTHTPQDLKLKHLLVVVVRGNSGSSRLGTVGPPERSPGQIILTSVFIPGKI